MKILVANRPRVLQEALAAVIAEWNDMQVATENPQDWAIYEATEGFAPHVVLVSLERPNEVPAICLSLFQRFPKLVVLGVGCPHNCLLAFTFSETIHTCRLRNSLYGLRSFLREKQRSLSAVSVRVPENLSTSTAVQQP